MRLFTSTETFNLGDGKEFHIIIDSKSCMMTIYVYQQICVVCINELENCCCCRYDDAHSTKKTAHFTYYSTSTEVVEFGHR
jgi:hypothetical protein